MSRGVKRWQSHLPALRRDPVLLAMLAWTLLAAVLFTAFADHTHWQVRVFWFFQPPLDALLAFYSWRSSRLATGAIRRFWLVLAAAGTMFIIGDSFQALSLIHI